MTTTTAAPPRPRTSSIILKNVTSNWAAILLNIGLSFVLAPLTVSVLGTEYYGIWMLLMQFTGYLWLFDFGVRESVIKYVAQYHAAGQDDELDRTVKTAVSVYSLVALAALVATAILSLVLPLLFNIPPHAATTARITALFTGATIAQSFVFNVFVGVLMGLQRFYIMARIGMALMLVRAAVTYLLLKAGYGIIALACAQFTLTLLSNLIVYRFCVAELPYLSLTWVRPRRDAVMRLVNYGKYVVMTNIGDKVVFATDSMIIGLFLPISTLTYYAIGGTLVDQFRTFIASMGSMLNPLSSSLEARKERSMVGVVLTTGSKATMALAMPVCLGFVFLGETFINLWMGPEFGPKAAPVLAVLAVGNLIGLPYYSIAGVLYGLGEHHVVAYSRLAVAAANVVLSVILVQWFGLVGVALGVVIPHALVVGGVLPALLPKLAPVRIGEYYMATYVRPIAASIPFGVACWFIAHVVHPASFLSFVGYGLLAMPIYLVPCWFVTLSSAEQGHVRHLVLRRMQPA